jgi:hypothetical protein
MKRFLFLLGVLALASAGLCVPAFAQTATFCLPAATSHNNSCIGIPDTSAAVQQNLSPAAGTVGQLKKATGSNNTAWGSQSSFAYTYLACGTPTFGSVTGPSAETIIAACEVPGGLMSANSTIRILVLVTRTSSSNSDTINIRIGTADDLTGTVCSTLTTALPNGTFLFGYKFFTNIGTTSTNICGGANNWASLGTPATPNINTANPIWIVISGTPSTTGDVLTATNLIAEYLPENGGQ